MTGPFWQKLAEKGWLGILYRKWAAAGSASST